MLAMTALGATVATEVRGKILVVDDNPLVLKITQARLEGAGFEVVTRDGPLGTSLAIIKEKPDVVLLDLNMPALAGDMLADVINGMEDSQRVAVIFHSSEDLAKLQDSAARKGVVGAIQKTEDAALFLAHFERLFDRARRR